MTQHMDIHDRRRFSRIHFDAMCELHTETLNCPVQLIDISLRGALIESMGQPISLKTGDKVRLLIYLANDVLIEMHATLTHIHGQQFGCKAEEMELESVSHLRRLVELNLGNEDQLERELEHMFPAALLK